MPGNLSSQVDEVDVVMELVENFNAMIVLEIAINGSLRVATLSSDSSRVLFLQDDLSDDGAVVGDSGAHVMEGAGMRKRAALFSFIAASDHRGLSRLSEGDEPQIPRGEDAALSISFTDHPGDGLLGHLGHGGTLAELLHILLINDRQNHRNISTMGRVAASVLVQGIPDHLPRFEGTCLRTGSFENPDDLISQFVSHHGAEELRPLGGEEVGDQRFQEPCFRRALSLDTVGRFDHWALP